MATEAISKPHVRLSERLVLPRPVSFWVTAAMLVLFLYASAAPTPLYRVYQAEWGFSAATLTAVFAIYVLFVLATLLIFGSLSDHIGRRPLILAAIAVDVAACVLFLLAHGPGLLFAARALEGIAVGAMSSTLGAVLQDLRPRGGLARHRAGVLGGGRRARRSRRGHLRRQGQLPHRSIGAVRGGRFRCMSGPVHRAAARAIRAPGGRASEGTQVIIPAGQGT